MSKTSRTICCASMVLILLSACGQKGPLFLPDKNGTAINKPAAASPSAAQPPQKIDPEKKDDSQKPPSP